MGWCPHCGRMFTITNTGTRYYRGPVHTTTSNGIIELVEDLCPACAPHYSTPSPDETML